MFAQTLKTIQAAYSGAAAKEDVAAVIRHHRIQASPGYRAAAAYVLAELEAAGLAAEMERYPADQRSYFWHAPSFQEWAIHKGELHLVEPTSEAMKLADYRELKLSVIQRSIAHQGVHEVVVLENGASAADYEGLDVAGKLVLTNGPVQRVRQLAVEGFGAAGLLFDGISPSPPVREAADLPDAHQYTSFWWSGRSEETRCFGFVLSPRQGAALRRLVRRQAAAGQPVSVRVDIEAEFYDGEIECVAAHIPGQSDESVIIVSHLCHPQPSANDNASGVAANLEAARTLQRLIDAGRLPPPRRTIRFLWMPEMTGSYAYLARHEAEIGQMIAGLNLDMVGEDQRQTGSVFIVERPPDAAASFAPDLLEALRDQVFNTVTGHNSLDNYALVPTATIAFLGGSDHFVFSDPTVGVPMPMLIQWPDKFYHTSADTLDKVSAEALARSGTLAAAYAYFIATAHQAETTWLAYEMSTRFRVRLVRQVQVFISERLSGAGQRDLAYLERQVTYALARHQAALVSLTRLWDGVGETAAALFEEADGLAGQALARAGRVGEQVAGGLAPVEPAEETAVPSEWETRAAALVPRRLSRGPGLTIGSLAGLDEEDRAFWHGLLTGHPAADTAITVAEYWADGQRTALEIVELVEMETGLRDAEIVVRYFDLLAQLGLVAFNQS